MAIVCVRHVETHQRLLVDTETTDLDKITDVIGGFTSNAMEFEEPVEVEGFNQFFTVRFHKEFNGWYRQGESRVAILTI